ncbi:hypothetical protein EDD86DRAFT_215534 [Gorgonomyces haynaldii]|nr:hypothetical protein EDD86DRAFT_215534 [Gorgonomyces haynaldii]
MSSACPHVNVQQILEPLGFAAQYTLLLQSRYRLQDRKPNNILELCQKLPIPQCLDCHAIDSKARLHCCLKCVHFTCYTHLNNHHQLQTHHIYLALNHLQVYCAKCKDYVYHPQIDLVLDQERKRITFAVGQLMDPMTQQQFHQWIATPSEQLMIQNQSTVKPCAGVRGLRNMGATCFMNTILQTMLHNPMLRAHFLMDRHNPKNCAFHGSNCMACELDALFQSFHSDQKEPYCPTSFLYTMWISQKHLAGYSQQDAHEFFISVLNEIHTKCAGTNINCQCIIHKTFGGVLLSQIRCQACGAVSSALDPTLDISIDINSAARTQSFDPEKKTISLFDCFKGYTMPEPLHQYACKNCHQVNQTTKQLSFKSLPPVLSIQLKRFEHSQTASVKIDTQVTVPMEIDLTPYNSSSIRHDSVESNPMYHYSLFGLVQHEGQIDTGHYRAYCKHRNQWYVFDDDIVSQVHENVITRVNGYMSFYIRSNSEYLPTAIV